MALRKHRHDSGRRYRLWTVSAIHAALRKAKFKQREVVCRILRRADGVRNKAGRRTVV